MVDTKELNPTRLNFYRYLNGELDIEAFEKWVYKSKELESELGSGQYVQLISYNFKSPDLRVYIQTLVRKNFEWMEYEKWRTIELLKTICNEEIEIVLATHKMEALYREQEEEIKFPLISIGLAIGCSSELDGFPVESEYHLRNKDSLKKKLEQVSEYKKFILKSVEEELSKLLNSENK